MGSEFHSAYRSRVPDLCLGAVTLVDKQGEKHHGMAADKDSGPPGCPMVPGAGAVRLHHSDMKHPYKVSLSTVGDQTKRVRIAFWNLITKRQRAESPGGDPHSSLQDDTAGSLLFSAPTLSIWTSY